MTVFLHAAESRFTQCFYFSSFNSTDYRDWHDCVGGVICGGFWDWGDAVSCDFSPFLQTLLVKVDQQSTAQDLLDSVCNKRQLDPLDHYVRITQSDTPPNTYIVLDPKDNIKSMVSSAVM